MARLILSAALVLSPTPLAQPQETPWYDPPLPSPSVLVVESTPLDLFEYAAELLEPTSALTVTSMVAPTDGPADTAIPPPPPPPILTLRERALHRLTELGASHWVIGTFDCIGWYESRWRNVRSATADDGVFQINDIHDAELWRRGLDPYVPEDAATYAWSLSRWGTTFTPWSVHALCGV